MNDRQEAAHGGRGTPAPSLGQEPQPVTLAVKFFRLVGAFCCFGVLVNLFICLARDNWIDALALIPFIGMLTLLAMAVFVCRAEFIESYRSRRFKVMLNGMLQGGLALVVLVLLLYLFGYRYQTRWDLTVNKLNQLSGETLKTLEHLRDMKEPIEVVFLTGQDPAAQDPQREWLWAQRQRIEELLKEYQTQVDGFAPNHFHFSTLNLLRDPDKLDNMALKKRMGIAEFAPDHFESVVFLHGEHARLVSQRDMYGYGVAAAQAQQRQEFMGERVFTATIRALLNPERKTVYFTTGHGETPDAERSMVRDLLKQQNVDVRNVDLAVGTDVPADATALVICGPKETFNPEVLEHLRAYLDRNGRIFALLDPVLPAQGQARAASNLSTVFEPYGIRVRQDFVTRCFKPTTTGAPAPLDYVPGLPSAQARTHLLATLRDTQQHAAFPVACVIGKSSVAKAGFHAEALLESVPFRSRDHLCWADPVTQASTMPGSESLHGPVVLGALAQPEKEDARKNGARLLVLAGSGVAQNRYLGSHPQNILLLLAGLRWMIGEDELIKDIPARDPELRVAQLNQGEGRVMFVLLVLGLPALLVFLGIVVWTARRSGSA